MILLIAVIFALMGLQSPPAITGAVEGTVTRAGSAQPVGGARVVIWGDKGPDFETRTDENGRYVFGEIPSGVFNFEVSSDGYLSVPNPLTGKSIRLTIGDHQRLRHDVSMTSAGVISGRILDDNHEPLSGIAVEVLRLTHDFRGHSGWDRVADSTTNDKGQYRVEDLSPDEYYIRASRKPARGASARDASTLAVPGNENFVDLAATYFPGTPDARSAAAISLRTNGEATAEFSLADARTFSVAGRVTQPDSRQIAPSILLYAIPQDAKIPLDRLVTAGVHVKASPEGWDFQLRGMLPGIYDLFAVALPISRFSVTVDAVDGAPYDLSNVEDIPGRAATTTIEIRDEDQKDIRLSLEPGVDVHGRVQAVDNTGKPFPLDIKRSPIGGIEPLSESNGPQVSLSLHHRQDFIASLLAIEPGRKPVQNRDAFTFAGVPEGTYDVALRESLPSGNLYLADVRSGARSVFDEGLIVSKEPIDFLEVVVGLDGGVIEGAITGGKPAPVFVVLAPQASRRQNGALYKTLVLGNASEPFRFTAVAPGLYSLFAFEISEPADIVPYRSADFLALHEGRGVPVRVEKNATVGKVRVPLIPR